MSLNASSLSLSLSVLHTRLDTPTPTHTHCRIFSFLDVVSLCRCAQVSKVTSGYGHVARQCGMHMLYMYCGHSQPPCKLVGQFTLMINKLFICGVCSHLICANITDVFTPKYNLGGVCHSTRGRGGQGGGGKINMTRDYSGLPSPSTI